MLLDRFAGVAVSIEESSADFLSVKYSLMFSMEAAGQQLDASRKTVSDAV